MMQATILLAQVQHDSDVKERGRIKRGREIERESVKESEKEGKRRVKRMEGEERERERQRNEN